jgi:hypothetical protein
MSEQLKSLIHSISSAGSSALSKKPQASVKPTSSSSSASVVKAPRPGLQRGHRSRSLCRRLHSMLQPRPYTRLRPSAISKRRPMRLLLGLLHARQRMRRSAPFRLRLVPAPAKTWTRIRSPPRGLPATYMMRSLKHRRTQTAMKHLLPLKQPPRNHRLAPAT